MDPISQGIIGSTASQVITKKKHSLFLVALIGLLSGLAQIGRASCRERV